MLSGDSTCGLESIWHRTQEVLVLRMPAFFYTTVFRDLDQGLKQVFGTTTKMRKKHTSVNRRMDNQSVDYWEYYSNMLTDATVQMNLEDSVL